MRIIPTPDRFGHVDSRAELRVAGLLAQIQPERPTACLYSVQLPVHEYKRMSEVDFLVVSDDMVLIVEVKGGRLARRDGLWTFTNRYGETSEKREGPFDQARSAMFALQDRLTAGIPGLDVAFGYLVLTPDQDLQPDLEWEPQQHAGSRSMTVAGLDLALRKARAFWQGRLRRPAAGGAYQRLLGVLRPDFDRVPKLAGQSSDLESEYIRLAERQYDLLVGAESNPRIVCTGGAGSGKTLLAAETARRAARQGDRVLLTCRSPELARLLAAATAPDGVTCVPLDGLDMLRRRAPDPNDIADVLVVDEAQDVMDVDTVLHLDGMLRGGLHQGRWRLFCDPNNQADVDGTFDRETFRELADGNTVVRLPFNCRNTSTVVRQTQMVTGADLGVARAGQGPPVQYQRCDDDDGAAKLLDAHLKRLRQDDVDPADVVVVTMRDAAPLSAAAASRAFRGPHQHAATGPGHPRLVTAAQIKGLEAGHVCVMDVEDTRERLARARLYVAMTRPRVTLWICLTDTAWNQIAMSSTNGDHT